MYIDVAFRAFRLLQECKKIEDSFTTSILFGPAICLCETATVMNRGCLYGDSYLGQVYHVIDPSLYQLVLFALQLHFCVMFEVGKVENARSGQKNKLNRAEEENLSPQSRAILEKLIVP